MDFLRGWNLVASTFMKQRRNSGTSSSDESLSILEKANVTGKNKPSSSNESLTKVEKSNAVGKNKISTDDEEVVWTENDTGDIMDLMETALNNVKKKLLSKLKRGSP
jgi:predicted  nucleic acid-binding Zn-ribbon protein